MSKNIEEIVDLVLPKEGIVEIASAAEKTMRRIDRDRLKQALTEGKLVVPMSEVELFKVLQQLAQKQMDAVIKAVNKNGLAETDWDDIDSEGGVLDFKVMAEAIYQAQFGGNK